MFGLRRWLDSRRARTGVSDGDSTLLELLDLKVLQAEAASTVFAGGRAEIRLKQARINRELARRGGDVVALRRAASSAELAARDAEAPFLAGEARLEQALCAMEGAEMFGDEGLNAAADRVLSDLARGPLAARATAKRARIAARQALDRGDVLDALALLTGYDAAITALSRVSNADPALAECQVERAEMTLACAVAIREDRLAARAATDLAGVIAAADHAYRPLTWAKAVRLRAEALTLIGRQNRDVPSLTEAVEQLSRVFDVVLRDHSPLDWARAQLAHGEALWALGEATDIDDAFTRASGAFDRAWGVLREQPALRARVLGGLRRGALAVAIAERKSDPLEFDGAEAMFRCELALVDPHRDPAGWAISQYNLGRLYQARARSGFAGSDAQTRASMAIAAAREVFDEQGLKELAS